MKKELKDTFTCAFDTLKLDAMRTFAAQKGIDLEEEIKKILEKKYMQLVPKPVREYISLSNSVCEPDTKSTFRIEKNAPKAAESIPETTEDIPASTKKTSAGEVKNTTPSSLPNDDFWGVN